jgi:SPP1 family predicted phage head-tail adaptor
MKAFLMDRRLTFLVKSPDSNKVGATLDQFIELSTVWAKKEDVKDSKRGQYLAAGEFVNMTFTIFTVRFNVDLIKAERCQCEGVEYQIVGIPSEIGRRQYLEIIAEKKQ